jgi:hypothetical protein
MNSSLSELAHTPLPLLYQITIKPVVFAIRLKIKIYGVEKHHNEILGNTDKTA